MKAFPREAEVTAVRHIGIENELYVRDGYSERGGTVPAEVQEKARKVLAHVGYDCGAREFVTIPISVKSLHQVRGEKTLREYYETIGTVARVSRKNGTHIHIGILDGDKEHMELNALMLSTGFFKQFQKIAGRNSHWAQRIPVNSKQDMERFLYNCRSGDSRRYYRGYYILTPSSHQTLEFRGPKGTVKADEVLAWVQFLENVIKLANRKNIHGVEFRELIKGERIEKYVRKLRTTRKLTEADLSMKLDTRALRAL